MIVVRKGCEFIPEVKGKMWEGSRETSMLLHGSLADSFVHGIGQWFSTPAGSPEELRKNTMLQRWLNWFANFWYREDMQEGWKIGRGQGLKAVYFIIRNLGFYLGDGKSLEQGGKRQSGDEEALSRWQCGGDRIGRKQNLSWNNLPYKTPNLHGLLLGGKTSSGRSSNLVFLSLPLNVLLLQILSLWLLMLPPSPCLSEVNVQVNYRGFLCL